MADENTYDLAADMHRCYVGDASPSASVPGTDAGPKCFHRPLRMHQDSSQVRDRQPYMLNIGSLYAQCSGFEPT